MTAALIILSLFLLVRYTAGAIDAPAVPEPDKHAGNDLQPTQPAVNVDVSALNSIFRKQEPKRVGYIIPPEPIKTTTGGTAKDSEPAASVLMPANLEPVKYYDTGTAKDSEPAASVLMPANLEPVKYYDTGTAKTFETQ
jgi:hypothetical protein